MLVLLIILVFIYHAGATIYFTQGLEVPLIFEFLYNAAFVCGLVWWLRDDAKRSAVTPNLLPGHVGGNRVVRSHSLSLAQDSRR